MSRIKTGGPAFPNNASDAWGGPEEGMTLRDYAVIAYTAAMISHRRRYRPRSEDSHLHWHEAIALEAGDLADAMIAAREGAP